MGIHIGQDRGPSFTNFFYHIMLSGIWCLVSVFNLMGDKRFSNAVRSIDNLREFNY